MRGKRRRMGLLEFARMVAPAETADYARAAGAVCRLLAMGAGGGGQARGGAPAVLEENLRRAEGEEDRCRRLVGDAMESAMLGSKDRMAGARAAGWEAVPLEEA